MADADVASTLRDSAKKFGRERARAYAGIIEGGIRMIESDPTRAAIMDRDDIREGVRSFHLELVKRRLHSAAHVLYFKVVTDRNREPELVVMRVLYQFPLISIGAPNLASRWI